MEEQEYSLTWFRERAFASLKKIDDGVWDFSDSLLIYVPRAEDKYESIQQTNNRYYQLVTEPERRYLKNVAPEIATMLPPEFEYFDLGPGTEHKEQFHFDALISLNKHFIYRPVDIDKKYLKLATEHAQQQGIHTSPIHSSFEELPSQLTSSGSRFISIGLTYSNYAPSTVLPLLKSIAGSDAYIFIDSQIRERVRMSEVIDLYSSEAYPLLEPKIQLLGLDPTSDIEEHWCDDGIRAWCTLKNTNQRLQEMGILPGAKLLTYYFLRPSLESLKQDISRIFPRFNLLDTQEPFVGAILKS